MATAISRYFTLDDALRTSHLVPNRIEQILRYGRIHSIEQIRKDLERTAKLLDLFCDKFGKGTLSSGYRSPSLNQIVHGAANSAHTVGLAFDWEPSGTIAPVIIWAMAQPAEALPYDKLIVEQRGATRWLHVQAGEEGFPPARAVMSSPSAGLYLALTHDQVLQLSV